MMNVSIFLNINLHIQMIVFWIYWVKWTVIIVTPTCFFFTYFHVATRKFKIACVPLIIFLLDSISLASTLSGFVINPTTI